MGEDIVRTSWRREEAGRNDRLTRNGGNRVERNSLSGKNIARNWLITVKPHLVAMLQGIVYDREGNTVGSHPKNQD